MLNWLKATLVKTGRWSANPTGWQYRHFWTSPFGASASTLTWSGQWTFWPDWSKVADMAGLGVISYGVIAVVAEGGLIGMWYALSKIGRDLEERRRQRQVAAAENFVTAIQAVEPGPGRARTVQAIAQAAEDSGVPRDTLTEVAEEAGVTLPGSRRNRRRRRRRLPASTN